MVEKVSPFDYSSMISGRPAHAVRRVAAPRCDRDGARPRFLCPLPTGLMRARRSPRRAFQLTRSSCRLVLMPTKRSLADLLAEWWQRITGRPNTPAEMLDDELIDNMRTVLIEHPDNLRLRTALLALLSEPDYAAIPQDEPDTDTDR